MKDGCINAEFWDFDIQVLNVDFNTFLYFPSVSLSRDNRGVNIISGTKLRTLGSGDNMSIQGQSRGTMRDGLCSISKGD